MDYEVIPANCLVILNFAVCRYFSVDQSSTT